MWSFPMSYSAPSIEEGAPGVKSTRQVLVPAYNSQAVASTVFEGHISQGPSLFVRAKQESKPLY